MLQSDPAVQQSRRDFGYVIMEHFEYPAMSGSNTICVATVLVELGMVEVSEPVTTFTLEAPAGLIEIRATVENGKATSITFRNVPAFAAHLDVPVEIPGVGTVRADIAWGGMFYTIADADQFGLRLTPDEGRDIVRYGEMLRLATSEQYPVHHPLDPSLAGVTISQLSARPIHRRTTAATPSPCPPVMPSGTTRTALSGASTGRPAAPGRRPGWRPCMRVD